MTSAVVLLLLLAPTTAWGQAGWYYIPSLRLTEEYDDNVFGVEQRTSDFITRATSGLRIGYRSIPFTLMATSSADYEYFARNSDLNGLNRGQIGLETEYLPSQSLRLRLNAIYTNTQSPAELQPQLGLELGRQESTQITVTPSISYQIDRRTTAEASYSFINSDSLDVNTTTHEARVRLNYNLTHLDVGTVSYGFRAILEDSGGTQGSSSSTQGGSTQSSNINAVGSGGTTHSHLVLLGWSRRLSKRTAFSLEAGPRFSEGGVDAEANASLTHKIDRLVDVSVGYTRSSTAIVGQTGTSNTQAVFGAVSFDATRSLRLIFGAAASEVTSPTTEPTTSQGVDILATYKINKWLSAFARYRFNHSLTTGSAGSTIFHNIGSIGLEATYSTRVDD